MLEPRDTYQALYEDFCWQLASSYNIANEACEKWAGSVPDQIAIREWREDGGIIETSYGELSSQSSRFANALVRSGVKPGDRIALLLPQSVEVAIIHLAIYKMGAIAVPLALLFGVDALEYRLQTAGARAIITNADGLAKINRIRHRLDSLDTVFSVEGQGGGALDFHQILVEENESFQPVPTRPDTPALMIFTSGTTGQPKGALHGHRVLAGHLPGVQMPHEFLPRKGDCLWTPADWAWAGGLLNILLPGLALGVPVVCSKMTKFDPNKAYRLMAEAGVRNTFIPPTALKLMKVIEKPLEKYNLKLRTIGSGGESLGRETLEWAKNALNITINEFYGQTECNLVLSSCARLGVVRPGVIGKPVPGHEVAIIDKNGQPCAVNQPGQIAVKRPDPVMFLEYWKDPQATREKFIGNWMKTGDQGICDEDGYIHFFGRDDDIITSAGFRIGPGEIEDCLIAHPAVSLAAVVGKPDEIRTEIVKAYIVLAEGHDPCDDLKKEITAHVRTRLSAHEYPREIAFVDKMPLTTTGKVIRRTFRERAKQETRP